MELPDEFKEKRTFSYGFIVFLIIIAFVLGGMVARQIIESDEIKRVEDKISRKIENHNSDKDAHK